MYCLQPVYLLHRQNYFFAPKSLLTNIILFDCKEYICRTCHSKLVKAKIPFQAVYNDMFVDEIPAELVLLEKLEQIGQRIVFEKIIVMPKGEQKKILKLKRKLEFKGHVCFRAVSL